jgi:hypothetical protein
VFYGIRYTKALQDILNTEGGRLARGMIQLSTPALAGKIEVFSQRKGKWSKSTLSPQDAAVTSIALFGMELARYGQTSNERLAGSTLQMALIDYAKKNPSAKAACTAVLSKWVEVRPHARRPAAPSSTASSAPQTADGMETKEPQDMAAAAETDIGKAWLQTMAESAARFMVMQESWLKMMPEPPEFDGPTAAAFAYGVWDSIAQQMNLYGDGFLDTLVFFALKWLDTQDKKTIAETVNAMLRTGNDPDYQRSVVAGGQAFRTWWAGPKGDFFPIHLGQCMALAARKGQSS